MNSGSWVGVPPEKADRALPSQCIFLPKHEQSIFLPKPERCIILP